MGGAWEGQTPGFGKKQKFSSKPKAMREHPQVTGNQTQKPDAKCKAGLESEGWIQRPEITSGERGHGEISIGTSRKVQRNCHYRPERSGKLCCMVSKGQGLEAIITQHHLHQ